MKIFNIILLAVLFAMAIIGGFHINNLNRDLDKADTTIASQSVELEAAHSYIKKQHQEITRLETELGR